MRQNFTHRSVILNTYSTLYNDVQYGSIWGAEYRTLSACILRTAQTLPQ